MCSKASLSIFRVGISPFGKDAWGDYPNPKNGGGGVLIYPSFLHTFHSFNLYVITGKGFAVMTTAKRVIVPFGKYNWIDGYDKGLARVKIGKATNGLRDSDSK